VGLVGDVFELRIGVQSLEKLLCRQHHEQNQGAGNRDRCVKLVPMKTKALAAF
jgi:hypothetical protein